MRNDDLAASRQTDKAEVDQIFTDAWEAAARINPLLLAKLGPEYSFERLREMISDCLKRGLSAAETRAHRQGTPAFGSGGQPTAEYM